MSPKNPRFSNSISSVSASNGPTSYLAQEYESWKVLFEAQSPLVQWFIDSQALSIATALSQSAAQANFTLPDQVVVDVSSKVEMGVPSAQREHVVGGFMDRLMRTGLNVALRQHLDELEANPDIAVVISAGLLRIATAVALVHDLLPSGRSVRYQLDEGDEIPYLPISDELVKDSAIAALSDAIIDDESESQEEIRGELLVPYVPAAQRFFLPQWVAFDDQDRLLVNSISEAETYLASMQQYVSLLHIAVGLAPCIMTDDIYQIKRYGILGQLVNQGRALARYQTREIIARIKQRATANDLNRGLSLSLPYFDDQTLDMKVHNFDVIPAGRIMFIPAFVVLAAGKESAKVEQDTRLDRSTRKHLLGELQMLATEFESSSLSKDSQ